MIIETIIKLVGITTLKIIVFLLVAWLAYKWANGGFMKTESLIKKIKKTYGIGTLLLLVAWWLITPSGGSPDDLITLWLIETLGMSLYIILCAALTAYLVWRMRITIVIYNKGGKK